MNGFPVNMVIGIAVFCLVLLVLDNKRFPAALAALAVGITLVVPNMDWVFAIGIGVDFFIKKIKIMI